MYLRLLDIWQLPMHSAQWHVCKIGPKQLGQASVGAGATVGRGSQDYKPLLIGTVTSGAVPWMSAPKATGLDGLAPKGNRPEAFPGSDQFSFSSLGKSSSRWEKIKSK